MTRRADKLETLLGERFGDRLSLSRSRAGEVEAEVQAGELLDVCAALRDEEGLEFGMLLDVAGVDYLTFGMDEWRTREATDSGFSRGVNRDPAGPAARRAAEEGAGQKRFAAVYQLLSVTLNHRLRLKCFAPPGEPPRLPSVIDVWPGANWFEREAFDLFGILFDGHPDLRRILTDYGFIGHPFRKDFPLSGHVEVRYDPEQGRVIYQPVTIEPRILVPRVIRDDNRYQPALKE
ncbi:MAG: NADH-quinone oxidoreductase subunit C [Gammaproteobacteria bacterium]